MRGWEQLHALPILDAHFLCHPLSCGMCPWKIRGIAASSIGSNHCEFYVVACGGALCRLVALRCFCASVRTELIDLVLTVYRHTKFRLLCEACRYPRRKGLTASLALTRFSALFCAAIHPPTFAPVPRGSATAADPPWGSRVASRFRCFVGLGQRLHPASSCGKQRQQRPRRWQWARWQRRQRRWCRRDRGEPG